MGEYLPIVTKALTYQIVITAHELCFLRMGYTDANMFLHHECMHKHGNSNDQFLI